MPNVSKFGNFNLLEPSGPVQGLLYLLEFKPGGIHSNHWTLKGIKECPSCTKTQVYVPKYVNINAACVYISLLCGLV
jgi:hypothetical protein